VVAKTEQNADDDTSLNTNPSTSKGMCQYTYGTDPNTRTGMSITGNGNLQILVPTYAFGVKIRGGTCGHVFCPTSAEELLVWDGIVCRNINTNIAESWMMNQSNTFDREIMEAMHFRRWLDIKACLKQNGFWTEKKKTDEGYDPTQNTTWYGMS
jgi:hypothetical protein